MTSKTVTDFAHEITRLAIMRGMNTTQMVASCLYCAVYGIAQSEDPTADRDVFVSTLDRELPIAITVTQTSAPATGTAH